MTDVDMSSRAGRPLRFDEPLDHNGLHPVQNEWIKDTVGKVRGMYKTDLIRAAIWLLMQKAGEEVPEDWMRGLQLEGIV